MNLDYDVAHNLRTFRPSDDPKANSGEIMSAALKKALKDQDGKNLRMVTIRRKGPGDVATDLWGIRVDVGTVPALIGTLAADERVHTITVSP